MRWSLLVVLAVCLLQSASPLKFLAYYPLWGRSHITFMGRLADILAERGHHVTALTPDAEALWENSGATHPNVKVIRLPQSPSTKQFFGADSAHDKMAANLWLDANSWEFMNFLPAMNSAFAQQCGDIFRNYQDVLEQLRAEQFDAGFSEPAMDKCGFVIFKHLGIESTAATFSIAAYEGSFKWTGLPSFPSYVPNGFIGLPDKMTFSQRVTNTLTNEVGRILEPILFTNTFDKFISEEMGGDFPDFTKLLRNASLFFVNGDPLIEFPRPIVHKVIDIGGVSVTSNPKPLNKTWSDMLSLRPHTVYISFGTFVKSHLMPDDYKKNIVEAIKAFPEVTFIWKYETPEDGIGKGIPNLVQTTWVPQVDMLHDDRLSLFITHCGQGSTAEATTAGVSLIVIPVMGDQLRNAKVIERIGSGIAVDKEQLNGTKMLQAAIRAVLYDSKYKERAAYIGQSIRNRPFAQSEVFARNMEFLARYGPLRQFDHYGMNLNFFQYYLIDVFAFVAAIILFVIATVFVAARCVFRVTRKLLSSTKTKKE